MIARLAVAVALLLATGPAVAQTMNAEAAKRFVTGKLFAYTCVDGSRGLGRIYAALPADQPSSQARSGQIGVAAARHAASRGKAICASLKGLSVSSLLLFTSDHAFSVPP
jgi:hypothetical protein